jgi:hypothetical protein
MMKNILPALVLGLSVVASQAYMAAPVHAEDAKAGRLNVRGSIVNYGGSSLKVKTREGETVAVVFVPAEKAATGLVAHQLLVGKNGVVPPM